MPTGAALFGNTASRSQNKNLVEFKAGKMTMKGKMVHPDKRKGLLYVYQSEDSLMHFCWKDRISGTVEDDLIIFPDDCEFKRVTQCTTGRVYVLKFKSSNRKFFFWVQEPKTDKDDENSRRINEVLNNPPTPGSQRSGGATPDGDLQNLLSNMSQQQLMQLFGGVGQIGGLSSLLGTMSRPSTSTTNRSSASNTSLTSSSTSAVSASTASTPKPATTATPTTTTTTTAAATATPKASTPSSAGSQQNNTIQLSDLQSFLSGLGVGPTSTASSQQNGTPSTSKILSSSPHSNSTPQPSKEPSSSIRMASPRAPSKRHMVERPKPSLPDPALLPGQQSLRSQYKRRREVDLSSALTAESLQAVINDPAVVRDLQQHLPSASTPQGATQQEQLRSTLQSPQFQQAMSMFSTALQSGQLGPVVSQFEVGPEAVSAANQGNMEEFVKALQKATISQTAQEEEKQPEKRKKLDDDKKRKKAKEEEDDDDDDEDMPLD